MTGLVLPLIGWHAQVEQEHFLLSFKGLMEGSVEQSLLKSNGADSDEAESLNH